MPDGVLLANEPIPDISRFSYQSSLLLLKAIRYYNDIRLIRRNPNYDLWAEDAERRMKLTPQWHTDDTAKAE